MFELYIYSHVKIISMSFMDLLITDICKKFHFCQDFIIVPFFYLLYQQIDGSFSHFKYRLIGMRYFSIKEIKIFIFIKTSYFYFIWNFYIQP